ncbi:MULTISPECIES: SUMF1/EgtB/PvdO family nonheme iron enzyme [unclassified Microcystis]|uniref:SUMF1/EgtB/PvdO family nonheme iron enzyme n=1 Tax=unclassified Microcystis TaxID=2643300 RepID=UPI0025805EE7|nr:MULTISPECIES: SUMF1/EgtB/PvdO family nonheme iron enzyme [unclassified Microcystis]
MTETVNFELLAHVQLSRRLSKLIPLDDSIAIDISYITCAEYQLFIDERKKLGKNHQPLDWKTNAVVSEDILKPITGVKASDAEAFCEWLTQHPQHFKPEFKYRIPTLQEAEEFLPMETEEENLVGYWCQENLTSRMVYLEPEKWLKIKEKILFFSKEKLGKVMDGMIGQFIYQFSLYKLLPFWTKPGLGLGLHLGLMLVLGLVTGLMLGLGLHLGRPVLVLVLGLVFVVGFIVWVVLETQSLVEFVLGLVFVVGLVLGLVLVLVPVLVPVLVLVLVPVLGFLLFYVADYISYCRIRLNLNLDPTDGISLIVEDYLSSLNIQTLYPYIDNLSSWQQLVNKIGIAWYLFPDIYGAASKNEELLDQVNLTVAECRELNSQYSSKREQVFNRFIASVLLEERRAGNIPAWQGIRIVRERI